MFWLCSYSAEGETAHQPSTSRDQAAVPRQHTEFLIPLYPRVRPSKRVPVPCLLPAGIRLNNEMVIALSEAAVVPHLALYLHEETVSWV
jgi:hypothetical protein